MTFAEDTIQKIINDYNNGKSMNSIAKKYNTYATTIKRTLTKYNVELRHDARKEGSLCVQNGEKLVKWAKSQDKLVTKTELAKVIGTKRLSPSYFIKYPELGQYIKSYEQNELQKYSEKLYDWLKENHILYKPNDRTKLKVNVTALLLKNHSDTVLQIAIKPKCVSLKKYSENMIEKKNRAHEQNVNIIFLYEKDFDNDLEVLKELL